MAPAAKRRKTKGDVVRYLCTSCDTKRIGTQFPDYNPSAECEHLINTCKPCLRKWVEAKVESAEFTTTASTATADGDDGGDHGEAASGGAAKTRKRSYAQVMEEGREGDAKVLGIKCPEPECQAVMRSVNMDTAASRKVFARFAELERKHIADNTPGWRWCLDPDCRSGQVHEKKSVANEVPPKPVKKRGRGGAKKSESKSEPEEFLVIDADTDICECKDCGAKACVPCDRPWHYGETCEAFKLRTKDRLEEEDEALKEIRKISKPCPSCKKQIEKNGGCPSMICSLCHTNFCWKCLHIFGQENISCRCPPVHERVVGGRARVGLQEL